MNAIEAMSTLVAAFVTALAPAVVLVSWWDNRAHNCGRASCGVCGGADE